MRRHLEGAAWLGLGLFAAGQSLALGLGAPSSPGSGFTPFLMSLCLCALAGILLARPAPGAAVAERPAPRPGILGIIGAIALYGVLLKPFGYLATTLVLMLILFRSAGTRWLASLVYALLVTVASYWLFVGVLKLNLPAGIF